MRFEIRAGGFVVILIGLLGLSGVVFFFGVLAGNDIAKQNTPDPGQVSSVYPLPAPPSVAASPAVAPMAAVNPTSAPVAIPPPVHARPPVFTPMAASSPPAVVSSAVAAAPHPANTRAVAKLSNPAAAPERSARKHPFNINRGRHGSQRCSADGESTTVARYPPYGDHRYRRPDGIAYAVGPRLEMTRRPRNKVARRYKQIRTALIARTRRSLCPAPGLIKWCAIAIGGGTITPSRRFPAISSRAILRSIQRTSASSVSSAFASRFLAFAKHPIISDEGNGHGCVA